MKTTIMVIFTAAVAALNAVPLRGDEVVDRVRVLAAKAAPDVIAWRRDFHAHPELSNQEEQTAAKVAEALRALGVDELRTGVAHHGVVALIRGGQPGPTVALRADMDALPIQEQTGLPFASKNPGVMHACGHDAHTAILLGAAKVLMEMRDALPGTVKLIFQPAEEGAPPGEEGGARLMIRQGVLEEPSVAAIFGLHVGTELESGKIACRPGPLLASVDRFRVTFEGRQSHAAMPWQGCDPIIAAAHAITAIQTIASRKVDARKPVVVSVGILKAGQAWNIIPQTVTMEGTIRSHDPDVRRQAGDEFRRIIEQTASAHGAVARIEFSDYGPVVFNNEELTEKMRPALVLTAGEENVVEAEPVMGGEDFAHYAQEVPGMYFFLGVRNESIGAVHSVHTPYLVIDEAALPLGVQAMALLAIEYLRREAN